ncbi:hypothetical protein EJ05DRAFT_479136 [Pseudovirgaria hyperparasitica]|uniref:Acyltransferase MbtK/IucB-like conserved domain-containing protein n=1 Tax=Pseudovirgaria hyperparasitica TaxID=470096 RepID=A0A6A6VXY9_9PEZI|nr:uncharacterized protein EJ05DRAFT_479136 [Pseudovirgaria hyperparasitica]KAF2754699.1 hypothetical protein EJ05DRAFT_479136 [Pseudovirgaria hyperparasitica]
MSLQIVHLPNGQNLQVSPVFGGLFFKSSELSHTHSPFPAGWTIVLNSEDGDEDEDMEDTAASEQMTDQETRNKRIHRFRRPTLRNDHLYISSISNSNSNDFKPAGSPTRQIAMMLWATLWWYFHQPEPDTRITTKQSMYTAEEGKPRGDWRININREGIFKGKVLLPKLERMGLIASEDSTVGLDQGDKVGEGWLHMFVSRRTFWQLDPRLYLYTSIALAHSPYLTGSPYTSRPSSPSNDPKHDSPDPQPPTSSGLWSSSVQGPFHSTSHLPTYFPPPPQQYTFTNHVRHPIRPKPPRQGEVFYTRYIPSLGQYLSFRVASLSPKAPPHRGPSAATPPSVAQFRHSQLDWPPTSGPAPQGPSDLDLLHKWMNEPRVSAAWGEAGPRARQEAFLKASLSSRHSFPVIGCWDGRPFGYFELYWAKEDMLGRYVDGIGHFDRGIHCLVGEDEFRGPARVRAWLSALVHYFWLVDGRTDCVIMEPRVDNVKLTQYCFEAGFYKEREIAFPHKQASLLKIRRDAWEAPVI